MMRQTLASDSPMVMVYKYREPPGRGATLRTRLTEGANDFNDGDHAMLTPCWMRMTRSGDDFIGACLGQAQRQEASPPPGADNDDPRSANRLAAGLTEQPLTGSHPAS